MRRVGRRRAIKIQLHTHNLLLSRLLGDLYNSNKQIAKYLLYFDTTSYLSRRLN